VETHSFGRSEQLDQLLHFGWRDVKLCAGAIDRHFGSDLVVRLCSNVFGGFRKNLKC
jgi:hypothetical protein